METDIPSSIVGYTASYSVTKQFSLICSQHYLTRRYYVSL